jgi:hypothetical protein
MGACSDELTTWRCGFVEPSWHRDALVALRRAEAALAYAAFRELTPDGTLPERPTAAQSAAHERAVRADAAYEHAKRLAMAAQLSPYPQDRCGVPGTAAAHASAGGRR